MSKEPVHTMVKRSWWDGHVVSACGLRFEGRDVKECWFRGGVTCPGCKRANRHSR